MPALILVKNGVAQYLQRQRSKEKHHQAENNGDKGCQHAKGEFGEELHHSTILFCVKNTTIGGFICQCLPVPAENEIIQ
jgi:hypothetical protein